MTQKEFYIQNVKKKCFRGLHPLTPRITSDNKPTHPRKLFSFLPFHIPDIRYAQNLITTLKI